jgi:hypothetical protein
VKWTTKHWSQDLLIWKIVGSCTTVKWTNCWQYSSNKSYCIPTVRNVPVHVECLGVLIQCFECVRAVRNACENRLLENLSVLKNLMMKWTRTVLPKPICEMFSLHCYLRHLPSNLAQLAKDHVSSCHHFVSIVSLSFVIISNSHNWLSLLKLVAQLEFFSLAETWHIILPESRSTNEL